jgi:hypothetical protein
MKEIEQYITIKNEIERCDFRIRSLSSDESAKDELEEIRGEKAKLETEISPIHEILSQNTIDSSDLIRIGYIEVFNIYLNSYALSKQIGKFVDLNQGMINPGYLLGMFMHDLNHVLISAGETVPGSYFTYSNRKWQQENLFEL